MPKSEEIEEIFSHIQDIIKEKKKPEENQKETKPLVEEEPLVEDVNEEIVTTKKQETQSQQKNLVEEPLIEGEKEEIITTKKPDQTEEKEEASERSNFKKTDEEATLKQEKTVLNDPVESLDESIKKINQVSRMTTEHVTFKDDKRITSFAREISRWNLPNLQTGICDLCGETIEFEKNLSGLTIAGNFFACEKCCKNTSKEDLTSWTKSKMNNSAEIRPIGLWVIQEKNKDKSILFRKK